jgi:hypothetical protein
MAVCDVFAMPRQGRATLLWAAAVALALFVPQAWAQSLKDLKCTGSDPDRAIADYTTAIASDPKNAAV